MKEKFRLYIKYLEGYDGNEMEDTDEYESAGDAMIHLGYMILRAFNDGEEILEIKYEEVK